MKIDIVVKDCTPAEAAQFLQGQSISVKAAPGAPPPVPTQAQQQQPVGLPVAAAAAPAVPGPGAAAAPAISQGITLDMVKAQMNIFVGQHGAAQGKAVLTANGVEQLRNAPPEKWTALYVGFGGAVA